MSGGIAVATEGTTLRITLEGAVDLAVRESAARAGRNPQTGETIQIAARRVPTFKAGKELRDRVNRTGA